MICEIEFAESKRIFSSCPEDLHTGDLVIFKLNQGEEIGKVLKLLPEGKTQTQVLRIASPEDTEMDTKIKQETQGAYKLAREKVKELEIPIKVTSVHIQFDRSLLRLDFLAEKRVGLKRLTRELAKIYQRRIELNQIGARTYARQFIAFGVCGRALCCHKFLREFQPITISTVKLQNLSCGTSKLTGLCGRLMCCLAYEKKLYEEKKEK